MAMLKVVRPKSFVGMAVPINVILDRTKIGKISNGQEQEFEISSGDHVLSASDFQFSGSKSIPFSIAENDTKTVFIKYNAVVMMIYAVVVGVLASCSIAAGRAMHMSKGACLALALTSAILGFLVIRKKCIEIKEF